MDNTNVSSTKNVAMNFLVWGVENNKTKFKKAGEAELGDIFKDVEIKAFKNTEKDKKRTRRTIPISCEKRIAERESKSENVR